MSNGGFVVESGGFMGRQGEVDLVNAALGQPMAQSYAVAIGCCGVSLNQLFKEIVRVAGLPLRRPFARRRSVDAAKALMVAGLAKRDYGWGPGTSLHECLERTWAWLNTTQ